jgi:glycine/D-amino acid oxidase-like deaminating enzyme
MGRVVTPESATNIAEYLRLSRAPLHITVDDAPLPTLTIRTQPDGEPLLFAFDGCVYHKPRTDGRLTLTSGYELVGLNGTIYDPVAGPFDDTDDGWIRLLAAILRELIRLGSGTQPRA